MEYIAHTAILYFFLLVLFRMSGKRVLSEMTTFDFILLLLVGEAAGEMLHKADTSHDCCHGDHHTGGAGCAIFEHGQKVAMVRSDGKRRPGNHFGKRQADKKTYGTGKY